MDELLNEALDALEWVHNADQTTDKRGVLVDMPQAMGHVRAVLAKAGRLAPKDGVGGVHRPLGCALAMRVMQSDLYKQLDEAERADCDELVQRNLEWFKRDSAAGVAGGQDQVFSRQTPMERKEG